jgi:hypothetical protein
VLPLRIVRSASGGKLNVLKMLLSHAWGQKLDSNFRVAEGHAFLQSINTARYLSKGLKFESVEMVLFLAVF